MITLTQQTSEQNTLTQNHLDMVSMNEVKKLNLACQLERLEIEMQQPVKNWDKIAFLKTDIVYFFNWFLMNFNLSNFENVEISSTSVFLIGVAAGALENIFTDSFKEAISLPSSDNVS